MNREIKFRAWDNFQKRWLYWDELKKRSDINIWLSGNHVKQIDCVCQYTGLKDKNGADVYEGDLMNGGDRIVEIIWNENIASFDCVFVKYLNNDKFKLPLKIEPYNFKYFEIIGNKYENEDLLK